MKTIISIVFHLGLVGTVALYQDGIPSRGWNHERLNCLTVTARPSLLVGRSSSSSAAEKLPVQVPVLASPQHCDTRRKILGAILVMGSTMTTTTLSNPSQAASPLDAGEAIRRSAANIPGYGPTDVFFPASLAGTWKMTRQVDFGNGREPLQLVYPFRFIRSIEDDAVVADRGFNQAELEKAITVLITVVPNNDASSSSTVRSYEWVQSNPNDLRVVLSDGTRKEIKVTKRATERTDLTVSSSEFQRITLEDQRGIPTISARRILTKWKILDDSTLEGLEIVYSMPGGDPMVAVSEANTSPTILSKSRMLLQRQ